MGAFFQGDELIILGLIVVILILAPTKLPALARGIGQAIHEFRKATSGEEEQPQGQARQAGS